MDWQDKVGRPQLRCVVTDQPIGPGEVFFSALRLVDGAFTRSDYSEVGWNQAGEPSDCISWWRQRRPQPRAEASGPRLVSHEVLLGIFDDLRQATERPQQCFAWMIALLLVRARKLRYLGLEEEGGTTWMTVQPKGGEALRIRDPKPDATERQRIEADLEQLFASQ